MKTMAKQSHTRLNLLSPLATLLRQIILFVELLTVRYLLLRKILLVLYCKQSSRRTMWFANNDFLLALKIRDGNDEFLIVKSHTSSIYILFFLSRLGAM